MLGACLGLCCLAVAGAWAQVTDRAFDDQTFVMKASEAGLAEVNMGRVAAKWASSPAVKEFAERMVKDHGKANDELIALANKKRFKVAPRMDRTHQAMSDKLMASSGAEFDRTYMAAQVKDHEKAVELFEKQVKSGKDEQLKKWAEDTLPHLKEHLQLAKEVQGKLKGGTRGR
jgi:putative membrane protein